MLCVKRWDPDGSHLVCADGLLWWLRTGYTQTHTQAHTDSHTQMATHWEWPRDGRADYWFAQINDSQPGHLTLGELHPLSCHCGSAHLANITASMQGTSQLSFNPKCHILKNIFKSLYDWIGITLVIWHSYDCATEYPLQIQIRQQFLPYLSFFRKNCSWYSYTPKSDVCLCISVCLSLDMYKVIYYYALVAGTC